MIKEVNFLLHIFQEEIIITKLIDNNEQADSEYDDNDGDIV